MTASLQALDGSFWLCEPHHLKRLALRVNAIRPCPTARDVVEAKRMELEAAKQINATGIRSQKGRVGVIPVMGPVAQRMSGELLKAGGTSLEFVNLAFDTLMADPAVTAIVLQVASPGGESYFVEELSDKIYAARSKKAVYAHADSMAASAALWIATAAGNFSVTPGGDVGSLGVFAMHVSQEKALEKDGVQVTLVSAGRFKTEFSPFSALSDEARAHLQEQVDHTYGKFLNAVKRNRNTTLEDVRKNYGDGRMLNADEALAVGLVDRVITFDDLMAKLTGDAGSGPQARKASATMLRLRQEHRKRQASA